MMPWVFRSVKIHGEVFNSMTQRLKLFRKFFGHKAPWIRYESITDSDLLANPAAG